MCIRTTRISVPITNGFGSMDLPPRFEVGERPIIPAEDIGIETFDLFKDIWITYYRKELKGMQGQQ